MKHLNNEDVSQAENKQAKSHHDERASLTALRLHAGSSFSEHQMELQNSIGVPCHVCWISIFHVGIFLFHLFIFYLASFTEFYHGVPKNN